MHVKESQILNQSNKIHSLQVEFDNYKSKSNIEVSEINSLLKLEKESLRIEKSKYADLEDENKKKYTFIFLFF